MIFESKYLHVVELESKSKTKVYAVHSKHHGDLLGIIKWYAPWRQYCFFPEPETVWSNSCLREIIDFVGKLIEDWLSKQKEEGSKSTMEKQRKSCHNCKWKDECDGFYVVALEAAHNKEDISNYYCDIWTPLEEDDI